MRGVGREVIRSGGGWLGGRLVAGEFLLEGFEVDVEDGGDVEGEQLGE